MSSKFANLRQHSMRFFPRNSDPFFIIKNNIIKHMESFHPPHYAISSLLIRILATFAHKIEAHSCSILYNADLNALIQNDFSVDYIFRVHFRTLLQQNLFFYPENGALLHLKTRAVSFLLVQVHCSE
jgi:hypothetical protein